ncbi:MAG: N-6 DNA methylase [Phycisphaerae bacterium]
MTMTAPPGILQLVEHFDQQRESYRSSQYNEAQLRQEFINPMFDALGWDMDNRQGYAEAYKDVIHEDAIKIGGATKAPDYCFRVGGTRKFFLEAKKPAVNIREDNDPSFQLRRYAWSAKLPLSILTNFEYFAVYDCRIRPGKDDKSSEGRILALKYTDYLERWDQIASRFSRDAVLKGSFDKFAEQTKTKRGTAEVDAAFLKDIESWRDVLARNIALRNPNLSTRQLNFAVQRIIDRVIFLRIGEDRGIESYGQLQALLNGSEVYPRMTQLFHRADERYNSGLFHFSPEKDRHETPDELTLSLIIDDKILKDILRALYYPESPYEFSVLPADILGQVYEQFLGKVIRLTDGHQAKVEDKPEVKKAGGVYYTPTYIVEYIVKNTVGKLLEGKTPKQALKLRILDPACGSGSFLIGAYQYLLNWYRDWYFTDGVEKWSKGKSPVLYQGHGGEWRLTTTERKRILLNNIFGVDIDTQAVEVTKLSLLLKVLEGESQQTIMNQLRFFHERALPDLGNNIKCGNSLIGPDFNQGQQMTLFDEEELYRINAFDWNKEFAPIMKDGGFDAVIGNPPYIRIQMMKEWAPVEVEFYKKQYSAAAKGNYDIYVVFVEKGLSLLSKTGRLGLILPHKFFNSQYGEPLREIVAKGNHLDEIVHFGHQQVFVGATTYTCLLFLNKEGTNQCKFVKVDDLDSWATAKQGIEGLIQASSVGSAEWNFTAGPHSALVSRLSKISTKLGEVADIFVGLQTSADDVFIMDLREETPKTLKLYSKSLETEWVFENELLFPLVSGTDVNRYVALPERQYILFPYKVNDEFVELIDFNTISKVSPQTAAYLIKNKKTLEDRERSKAKGPRWYGYIYLKNMRRQAIEKICVPRLVETLCAALDEKGNHFLDNVDVGGITLKAEYEQHGLKYLLGLLNSKLLRWYFPFVSAPFRGGWWSANKQFLSQLPIRTIKFSDSVDNSHHNRITEWVERMLLLNKRLADAKTDQEKTVLQRQIETTDREIDQLVYELYGLTEEEVKIVEGVSNA